MTVKSSTRFDNKIKNINKLSLSILDQLLEVFKTAENGEEIPNSLAKKFFEAAERAFHCAQNYFKKQIGEYEESDIKVGSYLYEKYLEFVENDCQESKHLRKIADGIFVWRLVK